METAIFLSWLVQSILKCLSCYVEKNPDVFLPFFSPASQCEPCSAPEDNARHRRLHTSTLR